MAESSKTLYCGNRPYPSNNNYTLKVSWSESSPNIANNTSVVSITGSIGSSNIAWDSYYNSYLKLYWYDNNTGKETLVATSAGFLSCGPGYGGTRSVSKTITVTHKPDGSLSGYAKVVFEAGSTSGGWSPASDNVATSTLALTTIARASDFSYSVPTAELGQAITMTIDRKSDAFTHKVEYSFAGSSAVTVSSNATTSASFTPDVSLATNIPNSTVGTLTIKVTTFNGSTQIGDPVTKSVDLSVPSSVVPTMGNPTAKRVDNGVPSGWGVYVKGYSQVTIKIKSASGAQGSTIKSYSILGPNLNSNESSAKSDKLTTVGTNTYTCRITDSRGRTAEKTVSITVVDYTPPSIQASASRCNSSGTVTTNGTYLRVTATYSIASVSSKNSVSSKSVSCNGVSNTSFTSGTAFVLSANCSIGSSYTMTASVTDALGNSASVTVEIRTASRIMNVRKNKNGIAFGKFAETDNLFEVAWDAKFNGKLDGYSTGVADYGDSSRKIQIGFAGAGLNTSNLSYIAGYTDNGTKIKNVNKSVLQSWLGVSDSDLLNKIYPVGSIYISVNSTNPGNFLGGTWVEFGQGKTLVGVNASETEFDTVEKTGGEKTHKLSISEMPKHAHKFQGYYNTTSGSAYSQYILSRDKVSGDPNRVPSSEEYVGGNGSHNNLQPYITVYFWKRTA